MIRALAKIGLLAGAVALAPGLVAAQQSAPKNTATTGSPSNTKPPTTESFEKSGLKKTDTKEKDSAPVQDKGARTGR